MTNALTWTKGPARRWNAETGFSEKAQHESGFYAVRKLWSADEYTLTCTQRSDLSKHRTIGGFSTAGEAKAAAERDCSEGGAV